MKPIKHYLEFDETAREIDTVMKPNVRDRLTSSHNSNKDKIRLIHLLISLGISHYFETEIEMILNHAFEELDGLMAEEDDLETVSPALCAIFRLNNDIVTYEREMSRGEVANGVNCYMKQHGVNKEEAVEKLGKMASDNYKIVMEELLTTSDVPRPVLVRCLNIARLIDVFCKDGTDEYTNPHGKLKDLITSLFIYPILV